MTPTTPQALLFSLASAYPIISRPSTPLCGRCGEIEISRLFAVHHRLGAGHHPESQLKDYHWNCNSCLVKEAQRCEPQAPVELATNTVFFNCMCCLDTFSYPRELFTDALLQHPAAYIRPRPLGASYRIDPIYSEKKPLAGRLPLPSVH